MMTPAHMRIATTAADRIVQRGRYALPPMGMAPPSYAWLDNFLVVTNIEKTAALSRQ